MDAQRLLCGVLAASIVGSASVAVSHVTAGPEWAAVTVAVAAEQKATKATSTPTRSPSPIGDDLIYDFVGPNTKP